MARPKKVVKENLGIPLDQGWISPKSRDEGIPPGFPRPAPKPSQTKKTRGKKEESEGE